MSGDVMVEDRPTEVVSVDWTDEYRVAVVQRRKSETYSIEQALELSGWLYKAAGRAQEAMEAHLAENHARTVAQGVQDGTELSA